MSAYVVSKTDIDLLISALRQFRTRVFYKRHLDAADSFDPTELGRMFWFENVKSVAYRYGLNDDDDDDLSELTNYKLSVAEYNFHEYLDIKPARIAKIAAHYEYQSCEHPSWYSSEAQHTILRLYSALCRHLPGYDDAPWGINDSADLKLVCNPNTVSLSSLVKP